jgi:hypothetical protein
VSPRRGAAVPRGMAQEFEKATESR